MYQIGALRAIQEAGLWDDTVSISASSIGVFNALVTCQYDLDQAYKMWDELTKQPLFHNVDHMAKDYMLQMAKQSIMHEGIDVNPFLSVIEEYIDEQLVRESNKEMIISAYNISDLKQEYHAVKNIPQGQLMLYAAASSRLPFFKNVIINGKKYLDGGAGDNIPYYSLLDNKHFDLVILIKISMIPYFIPRVRVTNISYDNEIIIKPSSPLGSPLEFKTPSFEKKYEMGYEDTLRALRFLGNDL